MWWEEGEWRAKRHSRKFVYRCIMHVWRLCEGERPPANCFNFRHSLCEGCKLSFCFYLICLRTIAFHRYFHWTKICRRGTKIERAISSSTSPSLTSFRSQASRLLRKLWYCAIFINRFYTYFTKPSCRTILKQIFLSKGSCLWLICLLLFVFWKF